MAGHVDDSDDDDVISQINIIPFVDIVLVLLIIFMVTSTAIVRASLEVDLPKAASGGAGVESTLNVVLTIEGNLLLNGEPSDKEELATYVKGEAKTNSELQAVISADAALAYGEIMNVIDIVKLNGVKSFALNIERKAPAKAE
jgi:biopolymer transport protein ExbD